MRIESLNAAAAAVAVWSLCTVIVRCDQSKSACKQLQETYSKTDEGDVRPEVSPSVYGRERRLLVVYDKRAPSRAAAALLAVVLRHGLRYRNVNLLERSDSLCEVAHYMRINCSQFDRSDSMYNTLVLYPAITWSEDRCEAMETCNVEVVPLRLQLLGGSAAPLRLYLHVALSAKARSECWNTTHWNFYEDQDFFMKCGFLESRLDTYPTLWFAKDAPEGNSTVAELKKRLDHTRLTLKYNSLESETRLRRLILNIVNSHNDSSALFLDYGIWENVPGVQLVQPPACREQDCKQELDSTRSLRAGDGIVLEQLAPRLLKVFKHFSPTPTHLREVLLEIDHSNNGTYKTGNRIQQAACKWAASNPSTFKAWYRIKYTERYWIAVFLCNNDQHLDDYKRLARAVEHFYTHAKFSVSLYFIEVDCMNESDLTNKFIKATVSTRWNNVIGTIAAGVGSKMVAEYAMEMETAMLLYDVPSAGVTLGSAAYAAGGTLGDLAIAIGHFITSHKWRRVAILSEETQLANDLAEALQRDKNLVVRNIQLHANIILMETLQSLIKSNARIVFINSNTSVSKDILCLAQQLEMTRSNGYVWLLREWYPNNLTCANAFNLEPMNHVTISYWCHSNISKHLHKGKAKENSIHDVFNDFGQSFPPLTIPMIDALQVLMKIFDIFTKNFAPHLYDLHGNGTVSILLKTMEEEHYDGVLQELHYVKGALVNPLVFVTEWNGKYPINIEKWNVHNPDIKIVIKNKGEIPTDGTTVCLISSVRDPFEPTCQDKIWFPVGICLLLILIGLFLSWRIRMRNLAHHDSILTAQLLAQRKVFSAELVDHLVDRGALDLYHDLGQGQFGRVRYGVLRAPGRSSISVAVKELFEDNAPADESELIQEAVTLASLQHPHVVRLIGVCTTDGPLLILMEYAFFGNLRNYFSERRHLAENASEYRNATDEAFYVSSVSITRLAFEACTALNYLSSQRLVHRDIRALNCLIDERRSLKLADFGMARTIGVSPAGDDKEYLSRRRGFFPVRWMAPESLELGVFTTSSDVWALGVLLLEMITLGARPYGDWPCNRVFRYICAGGYPPLPNDISNEARQLLMRCWEPEPEARVTAADLANELSHTLELLQPALGPIDPVHDEETIETDDYIMIDNR